ncbi:MAG: MBL fold metallo-hydrolase [Proteobacteria bacterium]|nr:MBL fold metallo-hydrolase [Pseudomonadota bacterium]
MKLIKHHAWGDVEAFELGYMPFGKPLMTSHFYIVDHLVIDTGIAHLRNDVISILEDRHPRMTILTHCHEDHSGNAAAIQRRFNIDIFGHPYTVEKMKRKIIILPYQRLVWGRAENTDVLLYPSRIETDKFRLKPIPTPGHSKDHTAYLEENQGWLFSGDLYLGDKIKIFRKDENVHDEILSLKTILKYEFDQLFCAHNPQEHHGKERILAKLDFLETIVGKSRALKEKGLPLNEIIQTLQTSKDTFVRWFTMGNVSYGHMIRSALFDRPS